MHNPMRRTFALLSILVMAACSEAAAPSPTQSFNPKFISAAADAPAMANPALSFYAKKGLDREAIMYYRPRAGAADSTVFVRFRVGKGALLSRPDGSAIASGDSLLITITLTDAQNLILDFQPAGLRFATSEPAELKISFLEADDDLNDDGRVDSADAAIVPTLAIWRRERLSDPWTKLGSIVEIGTHEIEALVSGFTGYAIAY